MNDIKETLANLFMNNFYENILSSSFIEDNLMYVITMILADEIQNIESPKDFDKFLDDTSCGYFLKELNILSFSKLMFFLLFFFS